MPDMRFHLTEAELRERFAGHGVDGETMAAAIFAMVDAITDIFAEVAIERAFQDAKSGGPEHDDRHTVSDWAAIIDARVALVERASNFDKSAGARRRLLQVAALAVAAIQSIDREEQAAA